MLWEVKLLHEKNLLIMYQCFYPEYVTYASISNRTKQ